MEAEVWNPVVRNKGSEIDCGTHEWDDRSLDDDGRILVHRSLAENDGIAD
jgi:hypothetical protein